MPTADKRIHVAVIRKMREQIAEMVDMLNSGEHMGFSKSKHAATLRDVLAQQEALQEADQALTALYGDPPAIVKPQTAGAAN